MPSIWRVVAALAVAFVISVGLVGTIQMFVQQQAIREASAQKDDTITSDAAERRRTAAELDDLRDRIDELVEQNTELADLLRQRGIDVPRSLVTRSSTHTVERDSDDDGDRDTVVVNPPAPSANSNDGEDDDLTQSRRITDNLPDVPLPDVAGQATNDVKKITDDALDGLVPLIP